MAINFPNSPTVGQIYVDSTSGFSYEWDGTLWKSYSAASSNNIRIIDDISGSFDGINQTFGLLSSGSAVIPPNAQSLIVNLGGIVQEPVADYTVSSSNITFTTPPASGLSFSGVVIGPAIPINTIPDGTTTDGTLNVSGNLNVTGVVTATGGYNIGIQSAGVNVTTGVITALNFVGAGNTFAYNAGTKTVDISIAGGGGGGITSLDITSSLFI